MIARIRREREQWHPRLELRRHALLAISFPFYALGYGVAIAVRAVLTAAFWVVVTVRLGWRESWSKAPKGRR